MTLAHDMNAEMVLNGILEEEMPKYFHICFFTDDEGIDRDNSDCYIFIPKPVCRIVDDRTVSIQGWYVRKKKLTQYVRGRHTQVKGSINQQRLRQVLSNRRSDKKVF